MDAELVKLQTLENNGDFVEVRVKRSAVRRTWSLSIKAGGEIILSVPAKMSFQKINEILLKHQEWISKRYKKFSKVPRIDLSNKWNAGEDFYYQGKYLKLNFFRSHYPRVEMQEELLNVYSADFRGHVIKNTVEDWLEEKTLHQASHLLLKWVPRFNLPRNPELKLRILKGSWGQCRSDGRITLHKFLSRMSPEFFEYVLVHEMCHLFHMNHGAGFKALLSEKIPQWREIKRKYG